MQLPKLRMSAIQTVFILAFTSYYVVIAFQLGGDRLETNTYPFSSWGMFSEVRDVRPYSVHKPYDESGIHWEVTLSEPFQFKEEALSKQLRYRFLMHRALAAKPEIDQPKIDAVVKQAYDFVLGEVRGPEDIRAIRMYHAFFRVPPYPSEPVLEIVSKRLLGKFEAPVIAPPRTAAR